MIFFTLLTTLLAGLLIGTPLGCFWLAPRLFTYNLKDSILARVNLLTILAKVYPTEYHQVHQSFFIPVSFVEDSEENSDEHISN